MKFYHLINFLNNKIPINKNKKMKALTILEIKIIYKNINRMKKRVLKNKIKI